MEKNKKIVVDVIFFQQNVSFSFFFEYEIPFANMLYSPHIIFTFVDSLYFCIIRIYILLTYLFSHHLKLYHCQFF